MDGKIYIPKPCHENWNKMTPEEKGRHCAVCSKVVKDFSSMKKNEIIDVLKKTEGEVCGRINIKEITPTNKKQKVYFLINGWLYRKAVYPIMALLGFTLVSKTAVAQTDHHVKGKMAYNDYHSNSKKITVVIKSKDGNRFIPNATINVVSGVKHQMESKLSDANGKIVLDLNANNLTGNAIDIEIYAPGYEYKTKTITLIKDVQTVEITMENEMMIMGEMMYVEPKTEPQIVPIKDVDSPDVVTINKCSILEVTKLPLIRENFEFLEGIDIDVPSDSTGENFPNDHLFNPIVESKFELYPNPATNLVNITTTETENFNLDLFDENGKKLQSVMNGNGRYSLDISGYSNGMYYLLIMVGGKAVETKKIIVTR